MKSIRQKLSERRNVSAIERLQYIERRPREK